MNIFVFFNSHDVAEHYAIKNFHQDTTISRGFIVHDYHGSTGFCGIGGNEGVP